MRGTFWLFVVANVFALLGDPNGPKHEAVSITLPDAAVATAEVFWDGFGVPHIYADDMAGAAAATGRAVARQHGDLYLRLIAVASARSSEFFGKGDSNIYLRQDVECLNQGYIEEADRLYDQMYPEERQWLEAHAAGFRQYADEHPEHFSEIRLRALPLVSGRNDYRLLYRTLQVFTNTRAPFLIADSLDNAHPQWPLETLEDTSMHRVHYSYETEYTAAFAGVPSEILDGEHDDTHGTRGSNAWAANYPKYKDKGGALHLANPHLLFYEKYTWFEVHVSVRKEDFTAHGALLLGSPLPCIASTRHVSFTMTVNRIQAFTLHQVPLAAKHARADEPRRIELERRYNSHRVAGTVPTRETEGSTKYWFDGSVLQMEEQEMPLLVRTNPRDMSAPPVWERHLVRRLRTLHGVVKLRNDTHVVAHRRAGADCAHVLAQFLAMLQAQDVTELYEAMAPLQLGMFTIVAADSRGDISYLFNGWIPRRPVQTDFDFWKSPVPGEVKKYMWSMGDYHRLRELPFVLNPASGYMQNANDAPWFHTIPPEFQQSEFPAYFSDVPRLGWRPQRSLRLLHEVEDGALTAELFEDLKHDTVSELARRTLPELIAAIEKHAGDDGSDLERSLLHLAQCWRRWDGAFEEDAAGAVAFWKWAREHDSRGVATFLVPWSSREPLETPRRLLWPRREVENIRQIVKEMKYRRMPVDSDFGRFYRLPLERLSSTRPIGSETLPSHGCVHCFRSLWYAPGGIDFRKKNAIGGDTWVSITEYPADGSGPRIRCLMSYGNSSRRSSKNYFDQMRMFAKKELRDCPFERADVERIATERESVRVTVPIVQENRHTTESSLRHLVQRQ